MLSKYPMTFSLFSPYMPSNIFLSYSSILPFTIPSASASGYIYVNPNVFLLKLSD